MTDYFITGAENGLVLGFVFYLTIWGLTKALSLLKIIK